MAYSVSYLISCTLGSPGKLTAKKSVRLEYWIHSWAKEGPPDITRINAAVVEALADANTRRRLADLGQELPPPEQQNPQALAAFHKAEVEKWWPIIKAANIKGE